MARIRKDVAQRQDVAKDYGMTVYRFPENVTTYKDLRKEYLRLADIADRRLRRLEELTSKDKAYEDVLKFAYDKAMWDIQAQRGEDAKRFMGGVPKESGNTGTLKLQSRINDVLKFLNSPTSTISGIKKVYNQRANTLNEHYGEYGINFTWQNIADFFENGLVQSAISDFASDTAMKMLGKYYRNKKEIDELFKGVKNADKLKRFSSKETNTTITARQMRYLYDHKDELNDLF